MIREESSLRYTCHFNIIYASKILVPPFYKLADLSTISILLPMLIYPVISRDLLLSGAPS